MKTLLFMRHGKSDWSIPTVPDADRPLSTRGIKDSKRMGRVLVRFDLVPDRMVSSPALRATETAVIMAEACRAKEPAVIDESLYNGEVEDTLNVIRRLPADIEHPLIVGHNPSMEETAGYLLSGGRETGIKFPTAGLVCFLCGFSEWGSLDPGGCTLCWFLIPRLLKAVT